MAVLFEEGAIEEEPGAVAMLEEAGFGTKDGERRVLSPEETAYLVEKKMLEVRVNGKVMKKEEVVKYFEKKVEHFRSRCTLYSYFRDRGYVPRTGVRLGGDWRVYAKGKRPGDEPSKYLVHLIDRGWKASLGNIIALLRTSGELRKELLLASVDEEGKALLLKISRVELG